MTAPETSSAAVPRPREAPHDRRPGGDRPTLTPGTELLGPSPDGDGRYLARRADGQVVRMPWLLHRVAALLDGTRDLDAVADEVGADPDGAGCTAEDVRQVVRRRLVPAGLVVAATGGPAVDLDRDPAPARRARPRRLLVGALLLAALVLVALTAAVTTLVVGSARPVAAVPAVPAVPAAPVAAAAPPPGITAPGGIAGPPTLLGRVVDVPDVTTAVVDVGGRPLRVDVAGLAPGGTPACVTAAARAFAERTLQGQEVTLVPDPTLPPPAPDRWRAYLVLDTQLSYTDAAIGAGWATAGEGRYRAGSLDAQRDAEQAGLGLWGSSCRPST